MPIGARKEGEREGCETLRSFRMPRTKRRPFANSHEQQWLTLLSFAEHSRDLGLIDSFASGSGGGSGKYLENGAVVTAAGIEETKRMLASRRESERTEGLKRVIAVRLPPSPPYRLLTLQPHADDDQGPPRHRLLPPRHLPPHSLNPPRLPHPHLPLHHSLRLDRPRTRPPLHQRLPKGPLGPATPRPRRSDQDPRRDGSPRHPVPRRRRRLERRTRYGVVRSSSGGGCRAGFMVRRRDAREPERTPTDPYRTPQYGVTVDDRFGARGVGGGLSYAVGPPPFWVPQVV